MKLKELFLSFVMPTIASGHILASQTLNTEEAFEKYYDFKSTNNQYSFAQKKDEVDLGVYEKENDFHDKKRIEDALERLHHDRDGKQLETIQGKNRTPSSERILGSEGTHDKQNVEAALKSLINCEASKPYPKYDDKKDDRHESCEASKPYPRYDDKKDDRHERKENIDLRPYYGDDERGGVSCNNGHEKPSSSFPQLPQGMAPLGIEITELKSDVYQLKKLFKQIDKQLGSYEKQCSTVSSLEPKIITNKNKIVEMSVDINNLNEQIIAFNESTNKIIDRLVDQINNFKKKLSHDFEEKEEVIFKKIDKKLQVSLKEQSDIVFREVKIFSEILENLKHILGSGDNFKSLEDNHISRLLKGFDSLKERVRLNEENIGGVSDLTLRSFIKKIDPSLITTPVSIADLLAGLARGVYTLQETFDEKAKMALNDIVTDIYKHIFEKSEIVKKMEGELNTLSFLFSTVTSEDVKVFKNIQTTILQEINNRFKSADFSRDLVEKCQTIVNVLVNQAISQFDNNASLGIIEDVQLLLSPLKDKISEIEENQNEIKQIFDLKANSNIKSALQDIESKFLNINLEIANIKAEQENLKDMANCNSIDFKISGIKSDIANIKAEIGTLLFAAKDQENIEKIQEIQNNAIQNLEAEIEKINTKSDELKEMVDKINSENNTSENIELKIDINIVKTDINIVKTDIKNLEIRLSSLEKSFNDFVANIYNLLESSGSGKSPSSK
ncbi:MAG: prominin family protein [Holosporales bacterium]|jgi:hypothetical protein|nr:prominin family protein [Holosporales bacterium]